MRNLISVKFATCAIQQFTVFFQLLEKMCPQNGFKCIIIQSAFDLFSFLLSMITTMKSDDAMMITLINAFKVLAGTNGPIHRIRGNSQFLFNMLHQFKRIHSSTIHFINKCKDWNMAQQAYLEKFFRLRLHTF